MSATQAGKKQHPARRAGCPYCVSESRLQAVDVNRDTTVSVAGCLCRNSCDSSSSALEAHFVCGASLCKCNWSGCLHDWCRNSTIHAPCPGVDGVAWEGDGVDCCNRTSFGWRQAEVLTTGCKALAISEGNVVHCRELRSDGAEHDGCDAVTYKLSIQFHSLVLPNHTNNITQGTVSAKPANIARA